MNKRKIAIFTGNRAEYGLQLPLLRAVKDHPDLEYQLIVAGGHLSDQYGKTLSEIENDGFTIAAKVPIELESNHPSATPIAIGKGILALTETFTQLQPDIVVVYADRFEGFAAVIAASQMNIITAHIEGGDLTEGGALDDAVRHAMTKLSHLHFATNQQAANRILAMGESDWRVFNTGFPAIDLIQEKRYALVDEVCKSLNLSVEAPIVLFTQHSVSSESDLASAQIQPSLNALRQLASEGAQIIITYPNNDAGGEAIIEQLQTINAENIPNIQVTPSLGQRLYHGVLALNLLDKTKVACVGNSSSGLKETPAFHCPSVTIGSRQKGRLKGENVLTSGYDEDEILNAIKQCLFDKVFIQKCKDAANPYYLGGSGKKIAEILAKVDIDNRLTQKSMTLKGETRDGWFR